jgi:membrane fusion protein (multidrug efflux system)
MIHQTPPAAPVKVVDATPPKDRNYTKLLVPLVIVGAVSTLIAISAARWDLWQAGADSQSTDNAYVRADISRLGSRVAGSVKRVSVSDFQRVKAGDTLVEIDPADYAAKQWQARAAVDYAVAQLVNLDNQIKLQSAALAQAEAQKHVADENESLAAKEAERQSTLLKSGSSTQQKSDQATTQARSTVASAEAADAVVNSARAQLDVIQGQTAQLVASVESAKAALKTADLSVGYTKIIAPFDGVVSERQVHVGDFVTVGTNVVTLVPLPNVYLVANFKETQLSRMKERQPATITVDAIPGLKLTGTITRVSPASGSQFALLPADNATGNFTKVVQRVSVRVDFDRGDDLSRLLPGMSATVSVAVVDE